MYIKVKVFPRSKKEEIQKVGDNRFEIRVKEKAERNLANKRVLEILAEYFQISLKDISIINGHCHSSKLLKLNDNVLIKKRDE